MTKVRVQNKTLTLKWKTLAQVFSCEFCKISKNTFFIEHLWTTASELANIHFLYYDPKNIYEQMWPQSLPAKTSKSDPTKAPNCGECGIKYDTFHLLINWKKTLPTYLTRMVK